ncbi:reverse transcriptase family protein [Roseibacillus persicicus]|uniref:reverse transcriptase family protein n=1 Tax=Roseibacillus persicicus TaxID=454148 RepID=UPI00398ADDC9
MTPTTLWLKNLSTLLLEEERQLDAWLALIRKVIPGKPRRNFLIITREVWKVAETRTVLENRELQQIFRENRRFWNWQRKWYATRTPLPPALIVGPATPVLDTSAWHLPELATVGDLADFFALQPDDLGWLLSPKAQHYHEQWLPKRKGGRRLLESPKPLLKQVQRTLLRELLDKVPPHECATGFRAGHSIVDFAQPHANKSIALKMDLANFFPSLGRSRIKRLFMSLGYREGVALALAVLTTHRSASPDLTFTEKELYSRYHLPQGAPTSPALANLAAFRLDCRLAGLAKSAGASYTRYADDLLFSGTEELARGLHRFENRVIIITREEGLEINFRKTRHMAASQRQAAAGLVFNQKLNVPRREFDTLKAILHNCRKHGVSSQNHSHHPDFQAHLRGRIAWIASLHPVRGERLRAAFEELDWSKPNAQE